MNTDELMAVLEQRGAVMHGHFQLSSGRHSDLFVQKFRVLEDPEVTSQMGKSLADAFTGKFELVASPAVGALVLGFSTALAAHTKFVFAERADSRLAFRRGFTIPEGTDVLVVEDVITTGGSAREVVDLVREYGGNPIGVGALLDRADAARTEPLGAPLVSLVTLEAQSWTPEDCPLCSSGAPLEDPGSRRLS
ncbi:MAG TPA: orotate phosphoribosyltransferase [Actinomycetota bacterium]|nr:orotate phosphoribosyltransferase [Actinomycetota bacterium]